MYKKKQQLKKRILIIVVIIIIAALAFAYVIPMASMAATAAPPETPPPDPPTSWDLDESTLPAPWEDDDDEEEDTPNPILDILDNSIVLEVGERVQISYIKEYLPAGVVETWETSNADVVVVNELGVLLAVGPGFSQVFVRAGDTYDSVFVTVNELKANRIVILVGDDIIRTGSKTYELTVGDVIRLTSKIEPDGAKVDSIVWKIGNTNVASLPTDRGQTCEFVANAVGQTLLTVIAGSLEDSVSISIVERGVSQNQLLKYILVVVIIVVAIVVLAVILTYINQKKKKEQARQKALAKRRREEAERRAREEADAEMQREKTDPRPVQSGDRTTMKINGTIVGAGIRTPEGTPEPERPLTLDDLD